MSRNVCVISKDANDEYYVNEGYAFDYYYCIVWLGLGLTHIFDAITGEISICIGTGWVTNPVERIVKERFQFYRHPVSEFFAEYVY